MEKVGTLVVLAFVGQNANVKNPAGSPGIKKILLILSAKTTAKTMDISCRQSATDLARKLEQKHQ